MNITKVHMDSILKSEHEILFMIDMSGEAVWAVFMQGGYLVFCSKKLDYPHLY